MELFVIFKTFSLRSNVVSMEHEGVGVPMEKPQLSVQGNH